MLDGFAIRRPERLRTVLTLTFVLILVVLGMRPINTIAISESAGQRWTAPVSCPVSATGVFRGFGSSVPFEQMKFDEMNELHGGHSLVLPAMELYAGRQ